MLVGQKWTLTQEAFDKLLIALVAIARVAAKSISKFETISRASSSGAVAPSLKITPTKPQPHREKGRRGRRDSESLRLRHGRGPAPVPRDHEEPAARAVGANELGNSSEVYVETAQISIMKN